MKYQKLKASLFYHHFTLKHKSPFYFKNKTKQKKAFAKALQKKTKTHKKTKDSEWDVKQLGSGISGSKSMTLGLLPVRGTRCLTRVRVAPHLSIMKSDLS